MPVTYGKDMPYRCDECNNIVHLMESKDTNTPPTPTEECPQCRKPTVRRRLAVTHIVVPCPVENEDYHSHVLNTGMRFICTNARKIIADKKYPNSYSEQPHVVTCKECLDYIAKHQLQPTEHVE